MPEGKLFGELPRAPLLRVHAIRQHNLHHLRLARRPQGSAMAVLMRGRELYGDRVMETGERGAAAALAPRSRSVSKVSDEALLPHPW